MCITRLARVPWEEREIGIPIKIEAGRRHLESTGVAAKRLITILEGQLESVIAPVLLQQQAAGFAHLVEDFPEGRLVEMKFVQRLTRRPLDPDLSREHLQL